MRPSQKYKVFWSSAIVLSALAMAYLIVPPLLPLNRFRADFEAMLSNAAGMPVEINGNLRLSLLGRPMLAANSVQIGDSEIESVRFRISWDSILNLRNAKITSGIKIHGLRKDAKILSIPNFGHKIILYDSIVNYAGKDYEIISGTLGAGRFSARIRAGRHKYNMDVENGEFVITNPNEGLKISGKIASDEAGVISANGTLSIETNKLNEWFDFPHPAVKGKARLSMNFNWDGKGFFDFSKIRGTCGAATFGGRIKLWHENGAQTKKSVRMKIDNADLDLSFLADKPEFLYNSEFEIVADGNIKTPIPQIKNINNLSIKMDSNFSEINIGTLKAGNKNLSFSAIGRIIRNEANNLDISFYQNQPEQSVRCTLSSNNGNWRCGRWSIAGKNMTAFGTLDVSPDNFQMTFNSDNTEVDGDSIDVLKKYIGNRDGFVEFQIGGTTGSAKFQNGRRHVKYVRENAILETLPINLPVSESMKRSTGAVDAEINGDEMSFVFRNPDWSLVVNSAGNFAINHKSARKLLSMLTETAELPFVKSNIPVEISGKYRDQMISDLEIKVGEMEFSGIKGGRGISLKTSVLDLDQVLDDKWFAEFIDNQYLSGDPLLAPFGFGANAAITADGVKLNGATYGGFIYSLDSGGQKMSISDSENGHLLLSVSKNKSKYKYLIQMNKFFVPGLLFGNDSPVNIENTTITAEAELDSHGLTAYDIRRNMTGIIDVSFDGGILVGLGTDVFYNNVNNYGRLDTENALRVALDGGGTAIKEMQITGEYSGGDFRTTRPFYLAARHTDITGNLTIKNDSAAIRANITLRGTSPIPKPIALSIIGTKREYSLSEILPDIDLDYLREFVRTHKKF
ncbi:MAG: AsmA family protein [Rickettsiales bacterium]|jgi:hypothetical protein|nr:AsmA family protein [Rickettsiales bacterium]